MIAPELPSEAVEALRVRWEKETAKRHGEIMADLTAEQEHAKQGRLAELGAAWGYRVFVARNDHSRRWSGGVLGDRSLKALPDLSLPPETKETVALIDVLWLDEAGRDIIAAFEVEKSTSIYSGILRLFDLAFSLPACRDHLYLVAPDQREREIVAQLLRPSLTATGIPRPEYILFNDLACNCAHMARFGSGLPTLKRMSKGV